MNNVWKKIRNFIYDASDIMELIMAVLVLIAILIATISLWGPFIEYIDTRFEHGSFLVFIGYIFNILIGIEFLKLLCHPNANTVLEVLTFLVARHMIIEHTTVLENFISIVSIAALFAMKKYLDLPTNEEGTSIFVTSHEWNHLHERHRKKQDKIIQEKSERLKKQTKSLQTEEKQ